MGESVRRKPTLLFSDETFGFLKVSGFEFRDRQKIHISFFQSNYFLYFSKTLTKERGIKSSGVKTSSPALVKNIEKKNGLTIIHYDDGSVYTGETIDNIRQGQGRLEFANGEFYDGQFDNDQMNGVGKYVASDLEYEGQWQNGLQNGEGKETWKDGSTYVGFFVDGSKNGHGKYCWPDGTKYEGDWLNGDIHGNGIFHFRNGAIYEGEWKNGKRNGFGKFTNHKGQYYEGEFVNDKKEGKGTMVFVSKQKYVGEFRNNRPHGDGVLYDPDGKFVRGVWAKGKMIKPEDNEDQ